jgi:hypothetical protein
MSPYCAMDVPVSPVVAEAIEGAVAPQDRVHCRFDSGEP